MLSEDELKQLEAEKNQLENKQNTIKNEIISLNAKIEATIKTIPESNKNNFNLEKFIENNYHLPANSAFDKLLLKSEENGLTVDMAINEIKKQPYNYELIQQVTKLIQEKKPSDSDKEKYKKYLEEVNAKIKEKPAKWLNNQEEVLY